MATQAVQRRIAATKASMDGAPWEHDTWGPEDVEPILQRMAAAAALGRTDRWKAACAFAQEEIDRGSDARWAVVQGHIYMCHACD